MGWRETLQSIRSAQPVKEREPLCTHRELKKQLSQNYQSSEWERMRLEVDEYESYLETITTVHMDCGGEWDWRAIQILEAPDEPRKEDTHQIEALTGLERFKPTFTDRLFGRVVEKRHELARAVDAGVKKDEEKYQEALEQYREQFAEWDRSNELARVARGVVDGDPNLIAEVLKIAYPFKEITGYGSRVRYCGINDQVIEVDFHPNLERVMPDGSKKLLKSGRLSVKAFPKTSFRQYSLQYVCACVLRIGRELNALFPVKGSLITAYGEIEKKSAHDPGTAVILSAVITREGLSKLDFERVDPVEALGGFEHNMRFLKTRGFAEVGKLQTIGNE